MLKNIKKGFGFIIGVELGKLALGCAGAIGMALIANDEKHMNDMKKRNPELWEKYNKFTVKKEDSVEESEEEEAQ